MITTWGDIGQRPLGPLFVLGIAYVHECLLIPATFYQICTTTIFSNISACSPLTAIITPWYRIWLVPPATLVKPLPFLGNVKDTTSNRKFRRVAIVPRNGPRLSNEDPRKRQFGDAKYRNGSRESAAYSPSYKGCGSTFLSRFFYTRYIYSATSLPASYPNARIQRSSVISIPAIFSIWVAPVNTFENF